MQLPPWICVLLATVFLWQAGRAQLTVVLEEIRAVGSNPTMELIVDEARSFNLVPGFTYRILCRSSVGFGGLLNVWQDDGGNGITIMTPAPELNFDQTAVYSTQLDAGDANEWSLVLQSFSESSTGTYVCQTEEGTTNATLVIGAGNPTIIPNTPRLELTEGFLTNRPTLRALASSDPLPDRIMWLFEGQELITDNVFIVINNNNDVGELLFPQDITIDNAGDYVFRMESGAGNLSLTLTVVVNLQPSVSIDPSAGQTVNAGDSITITCTDGHGSPTPTFTWFHNDEVVQSGERVTIATNGGVSSLDIDPIQREDAGNYECLATNIAGQSRMNVDVVVQFRPVLDSLAPAEAIAAVGEAIISLQARLVAAVPSVSSYTWSRLTAQGSVILTPSEKYSFSEDSLILNISNVESADHGLYTLEATNARGTGSTDFVLVVLAPITETPTYAAYGTSVTLQVDILAPQSSATTFSIDARFGANPLLPLDSSEKYSGLVEGSTATLAIASVELPDSGLYAIIISGEDDSAEVVFELTVLFPPAPPTNLIGTSVSACVAMVTWQPAGPPAPDTAAADFTVIERQSGDTMSVWEAVADIAVGTSETTVDLPGIEPGALYRFRARSRSALVGTGAASQPSNNVTGYPAISFPTVESPVGSAAGSDRVSLRWELPQSACFVFARFDVKCYPRDAGTSGITREVVAGRGNTSVEVPGLTPDLRYECDITSNFEDGNGNAFDFSTQSELIPTFTYPEPPPFSPDSVPVEEPGKPPTETTITVRFTLPENQDTISYYQVIVLWQESKDPPPGHPDDRYPPGFQFTDMDDGEGLVPYIAAEVDKSDFNTLFTIGGGPVEGSTFANAELSPGTYYTSFLRAFVGSEFEPAQRKRQTSGRQNIVFSSSDFLPGIQTEMVNVDTGGSSPNTRTIGIAVAAIVVGVLVIAVTIIIIGVVCLHRMKARGSLRIEEVSMGSPSFLDDNSSKGGTPEIPEVATPDLAKRQSGIMEMKPTNEKHSSLIPSGPISVEHFDSHIEVFDAKRQLLFQAEFDWIQAHAPWHPAEGSNHPLNEDKNRYSNITAYDHTRVRLTPIEGIQASDYINANFIVGYKQEKAYIATQGPLDQTVCDFWRMVWEQNTATIVMLTGLVELGKNKCHQYWPDNTTTVYGSLQVTLEHSVVLPDYTIRNLRVLSLMTGDSRTVLQFHFTKWPDYGTPKLAAPLLNFLRAVHASNPDSSGPINIHCSAGVGRSGTVICIDHCLNQARAENIVDIQGCVSRMREQRNYMVQTEQQYTFIHYAVMEAIAYGDTSFPLADFPSSYQQMQERTGQTGSTLVEEEFARLGMVRTMVKKSSFVQKVKQKQANGRRSIHYPSVQYENSATNPEYNAHYIDSYSQPKLFIAADIPTPESAARFWQMVWDQGCSYIIMLTPLDAEHYCYWPSSHGQEQHGNVVVEVTEESAEHLYTTRTITLTNAKDGISHRVQQYQFIGWTSNYFPPVPTFVSFVCEVLKGVETLEKNQRLLVHDIESLGPSGIFCSLCYCIERLRVERMVDVFQAVQKIQLQRPKMVESMQQYAFVYDCVYEFIRTHSNS